MKYGVRSGEMTALLAGVLAAQWFSSTAAGFVDACGNAVFLAILPAGLALAGLAAASCALAPERGLLTVCAVQKGMKPFALVAAALFLLLAATALRDALSMLSLTLLPKTPRWCALLYMLPVLVVIGFLGTASVSRAVKLLAPVFLGLYLLVLVLSVWNQFNVYNFFPILGGGPAAIGKTALSALSAGAWLPMLWIDRAQLRRPVRAGVRACLWATGICTVGYLFYALLFPNGSATDISYPLHRLSVAGGLSYAFQRAQSLFVFVWLPLLLAASGAGLSYAVRCAQAVLPVRRAGVLVCIGVAVIALLGLQDIDVSPAWVRVLLQTNVQAWLLLPLLVPMIAGRVQERRLRREARQDA